MLFIRRIGRLIRGKATPAQIFVACLIGALLGFAPGFTQAPALVVFLLALLALLNANVPAALLAAIPATLLALVIMPLSLHVGRFLLDGPSQPFFAAAINAPVLALFGLEYYATTGGLVIGLVFGVLVGYLMVVAVTGYRARMAELEEGSATFSRYASTWWAHALAWIFVGGSHGKLTYRELLERSEPGNPIRIAGVAAVVVIAIIAILVQRYASEPVVTWAVQRGLERANGATVDLQSARLDLGGGRFEAVGLAMADPNALETDLLRIGRLDADVALADLLRRRLRMNRVVLIDASTGAERDRPGRLVGPPPRPTEEDDWRWGDMTLEDVLETAEIWKQRLAHLREWLERLDRIRPDERGETLRERLEREIRQKGYRHVSAAHLIQHTPWVTLSEVVAARVDAIQLDGELLEIHAHHLSTQPRLLDDAPRLQIRSESGRFDVDLEFAGLTRDAAGENAIRFAYLGLPAETIGRQLVTGDVQPLRGGTIDVAFDGRWRAGIVDFPLQVTIRESTVTIPGVGTTDVDRLLLPIRVRGPIDNPRVTLHDEDLAAALVEAGRDELARRVRAEVEDVRERVEEEVEERIEREAGRVLERVRP
jgi:uncharacterized protein (TIGR03546 family)